MQEFAIILIPISFGLAFMMTNAIVMGRFLLDASKQNGTSVSQESKN